MWKKSLALVISAALSSSVWASSFEAITLGSKGGIQDGNLTSFMLKSEADSNYVLLDAGSVVNGLIVAEEKGTFNGIEVPEDSPYTKVGYMLREKIKGYFISHAHLDHVAGMIISSPDDSNKPIYGLESTNKALMDNYFNWSAWPNFGNDGKGYKLNKYQYVNLMPEQWTPVSDTKMEVMALPLRHSGGRSTAFLMKNPAGEVFVYFGDTGPDLVEKASAMNNVWENLAPYVKQDKLKGIIIEVSFTNSTPDKSLFGHLTPNWLMKELSKLEELSGEGSLEGLNVVVSHIKYSLKKGEDPKEVIKAQLEEINDKGINFIYPTQGEKMSF
ncbi:MBL fold metallo-hydrolase [Vibrio maerlii]|uniref:MBL fold metallo-hydrolase n=1 Tax=Vibrio maerlii TaxID=2231648 RepID=UPI000E3ED317|nr:3',5'-cyclic-nucleotide phosphodiesterase [Vibrio maerlii]